MSEATHTEDEEYAGSHDGVIRYLSFVMRSIVRSKYRNQDNVPSLKNAVTDAYIVSHMINHHSERPKNPEPKSSIVERVMRHLKNFRTLVLGGNVVHEAEHAAKLIFLELEHRQPELQEQIVREAVRHLNIGV